MKPVLPARRPSQAVDSDNENENDSKPMGIAARIASLQLSPNSKPSRYIAPKRTIPPPAPEPKVVAYISTPREEEPSQLVNEEFDPYDDPRDYVPSPEELARLLARRPPPCPVRDEPPPLIPRRTMPPMPSYFPEPEPELEPEPEPESEPEMEELPQRNDCLKCRDFSDVDAHGSSSPLFQLI